LLQGGTPRPPTRPPRPAHARPPRPDPRARPDPTRAPARARARARAQWNVPDGVEISAECRDLLARMLVRDPEERITMAQIHTHPWFTANLPAEVGQGGGSGRAWRRHLRIWPAAPNPRTALSAQPPSLPWGAGWAHCKGVPWVCEVA
jgi:serine/threonine protein kinase